jgi:segregation and condensation protein A
MTYKVELDVYNGPMDLLLYLIKREEVDIREVQIAKIADQYLAYLDLLKALDIELAGDFLVMAATLLEIKSRSLLPRPPVEVEEGEEEEDPRETLIRQLIEYRRFKEAAGLLDDRGREMARRFARQVDERLLEELVGEAVEVPAHELLEGVEVWDLFTAFSEIVRTLGYSKPREVVYDDTPVEQAVEDLLARLKAEKSLLFVQLFDRTRGLGYLITMFLATLELTRQRLVGVEQTADFKEIRLFLRDPEAETYRAKKPRGAAASADGLARKRPRRPTPHQREQVREMMDDVELEKTEFDTILESIQVPDVEPFRPIYSEKEILGQTEGRETPAEEADATERPAAEAEEPVEDEAGESPDAPEPDPPKT